MGQIRVVLIFNEDNERQKEIGEYLKSQKEMQNGTDYRAGVCLAA